MVGHLLRRRQELTQRGLHIGRQSSVRDALAPRRQRHSDPRGAGQNEMG